MTDKIQCVDNDRVNDALDLLKSVEDLQLDLSEEKKSGVSENTSNQIPPQVIAPVFNVVADFIKSGKCTRIIVMTGAGISVSAGIPDFRSPGTGLYENLQKYNLPSPEAIFDISYFRTNPKPFFQLAKELYPGQFKGTKCHYFIKLLSDKGLLLRNYTQNIDTLELSVCIPQEKVVFAHGSFAGAKCIDCNKVYTIEMVKQAIINDEIPKCSNCINGVVKPDIVFFGEKLPERFFKLAKMDFLESDLLIVIGTSLTVYPFAGLVSQVDYDVPRVLVNDEVVGDFKACFDDCGDGEFSRSSRCGDFGLIGDCQDSIEKLISALGWEDDLRRTMSEDL